MTERYVRRSKTDERQRLRGLSLIEVAVVVVILGVILAILLVVLPGPRELSRRLVCSANVKGIGTSAKIYANDHRGRWDLAFDETAIGRIKYTGLIGGGRGTPVSPSRTQPSRGGRGEARELSPTRAFWQLVRSGSATVKQFICPTSSDVPDGTDNIGAYYDFAGYENISYGFQVPFGPRATIATEGTDNRMPLAADKGPYVDANIATPPPDLGIDALPGKWRLFNSPNHSGEGQNVLFADGHVSFQKTPIVGIDHDNIYTISLDNIHPASRIVGESPWRRNAHPFAPVDALGRLIAGTDSVIFP